MLGSTYVLVSNCDHKVMTTVALKSFIQVNSVALHYASL